MVSDSVICSMLFDVGYVELPKNTYSDHDITNICMYFHEICQTGRDLEVVFLPDCYFLYIDTRLNADRYMKALQIKVNDLEGRLCIYKAALKNVSGYLGKAD